MPASMDLTETQVLAALRTFLTGILPDGIEVIQGQGNRVPEPNEADFVLMTPILRTRLETNRVTYGDVLPAGLRYDLQPTQITVQLDIHGPAGADNAQMIGTLFRSDYATTQFAASGIGVVPLYASDPRQAPFINAEQQYEQRWTIDAVLQINPVVTTGQQFADALDVGLIDVDAVYPP